MFKSKLTPRNFLALLGLIGSLIWLAIFSFPDDKLYLVFCDVGQGDAILISRGFDQVLIDGGPNDKVLACLSDNMPFWDKTLEIVALTHPEADHLTGLISVFEKYKVDFFLTGPEGNDSAGYAALRSKIKGQRSKTKPKTQNEEVKVVNPYAGEKIKLGEIVLHTLWPEREWTAEKISNIKDQISKTENGTGAVLGAKTTHKNLNDFSLVFLLEYKNKKILLMGDADRRVQKNIVLSSTSLPIDILKFPHHGSKTGTTEEFLQKINPKEAVISVGKNSYGHPTVEILDMLRKFGVLIRRTDIEGEIKYTF